MKCRRFNEAQDRQQCNIARNHEHGISHGRGCKLMMLVQQESRVAWLTSKIRSKVRLYANHVRLIASRKMQKTHDFASSSTALCKQCSPDCKSQEIKEMLCGIRDAANSRCCLHQYAPPQRSNAYLCWPQILQKRYKLN